MRGEIVVLCATAGADAATARIVGRCSRGRDVERECVVVKEWVVESGKISKLV